MSPEWLRGLRSGRTVLVLAAPEPSKSGTPVPARTLTKSERSTVTPRSPARYMVTCTHSRQCACMNR